MSSFSNWGNGGHSSVDVAMLGESIRGPDQDGDPALKSGTSQATAIVSGIAVQLATHMNYVSYVQLKSSLLNGAVPALPTHLLKGIAHADSAFTSLDSNGTQGVLNTYYADNDNDGFGDLGSIIQACSPPLGFVADSTDCNDSDSSVNPAAAEACNGMDDDCSGSPEAGTNTWTGNGDGQLWTDPLNWEDGIIPLSCQDVVIPFGNVAIPVDSIGSGKTLEVKPGAELIIDLTGQLDISNQ